jgi:hypothetical protein
MVLRLRGVTTAVTSINAFVKFTGHGRQQLVVETARCVGWIVCAFNCVAISQNRPQRSASNGSIQVFRISSARYDLYGDIPKHSNINRGSETKAISYFQTKSNVAVGADVAQTWGAESVTTAAIVLPGMRVPLLKWPLNLSVNV